jgi:SAM-dependent methyltransferase
VNRFFQSLLNRLRSLWLYVNRCRFPLETFQDSPDLFRAYRSLLRSRDLKRAPGGWIYQGTFYPDYLTVGGASHAIFHMALQYCTGKGVDIGAGYWPLPGAIPIDISKGNRIHRTLDEFPQESLDFIFSSHCLEHIQDWQSASKEWISKVRPGGIVFLYLPHPECTIWNPGSPFVGADHKWKPEPEIIKNHLVQSDCELVTFDDGPDAMGSFYVCARKIR